MHLRRCYQLAVLLWFAICCSAPWAAAPAVVHYAPVGKIYEYRWKLLALALAHTRASDGEVCMRPSPINAPQDRILLLVRSGDIDVTTFGSTAKRETLLRPIRIDILRGMLGYRVFLIRQKDAARIAQLSRDELRQHLQLGFNSQWADLAILQSNGFHVTTSPSYDGLFAMLASSRFDAFPRGLNEAWHEIDEQTTRYPQLTVEKTWALFTPYPVYFWVRKDNIILAKQIERGLNQALAYGSFHQLFMQYYANEIEHIKNEKRRVIYLNNPLLPPNGAEIDTHWWWPSPNEIVP